MRKQKKLSLNKTTLRNLQSKDLSEVNGGYTLVTVTTNCTAFGSCVSFFYPDGCWCASGPI